MAESPIADAPFSVGLTVIDAVCPHSGHVADRQAEPALPDSVGAISAAHGGLVFLNNA
jgi:hypothetical protein